MWTLIPLYLYLRPHILHYHLLPFALYVGLINAYSVGQIIVAHLTKSRFAYQNVLLLPLVFGVLDSAGPVLAAYGEERFGTRAISFSSSDSGSGSSSGINLVGAFGWPSALGPAYQVPFVFASLGLALGVYGSFVVDVITGICDYLDIWCLTIKHPYVEPVKRVPASGRGRGMSPSVEGEVPAGSAAGEVGAIGDGKRSLRGRK